MPVVSVLNQKGGVGKTTLSINLSRSFSLDNKNVLLIDSDLQRSAREWHSRADGELLNVIGIDVPTIDKDVRKIDMRYDWIFIDGAGRLTEMVAKTLLCSDVVLIPIQPSPYDFWASEPFIDLVQQRIDITGGKLKAAFIISNQKSNTTVGKEIREVLKDYTIPAFLSGTYNRVVYSDCATNGHTVFEATRSGSLEAKKEISDIKNELMEFML